MNARTSTRSGLRRPGHLTDTVIRDRVEAGGEGHELLTRVRFHSHCWSEAHDPARHGEGKTFADEYGRPRVACPERTDASRLLPVIVASLWSRDLVVVKPSVIAVQVPWDGGSVYATLFKLDRSTSGAVHLEMTVVTAHRRAPFSRHMRRTEYASVVEDVLEGRTHGIRVPAKPTTRRSRERALDREVRDYARSLGLTTDTAGATPAATSM